MELPPLVPGTFVKRDNRFRATVTVAGRQSSAHVANSGRLGELFTAGRTIWLSPAANPARKTAYDLRPVDYADTLISVDARLPNQLLAEALESRTLVGLDYPDTRREVRFGNNRLDFRLSGPRGVCWLETKSFTLVTNGLAQFPDAPTARGRRHLEELILAKSTGDRAVVIFVVQRPDAFRFTPYREADPQFARGLEQAAAAGVEIRAFTCSVTLKNIAIGTEISVTLR